MADFFAFARARRTGIGRWGGFLRWMRLISMRSRKSAWFFFDR
jgi:hypothetical protein